MSLDFKTLLILLPFLAASLIGLNYALNEHAFGKVSLSTYTIAYCVVAIGAAVLMHMFTPEKIDFSVLAVRPVAVLVTLSIVASTLAWMITIYTIKNISANYTAIAELTFPFFTVLFGYFIYGRQISLPTAMGGILIVAGSMIIVIGKFKSGG